MAAAMEEIDKAEVKELTPQREGPVGKVAVYGVSLAAARTRPRTCRSVGPLLPLILSVPAPLEVLAAGPEKGRGSAAPHLVGMLMLVAAAVSRVGRKIGESSALRTRRSSCAAKSSPWLALDIVDEYSTSEEQFHESSSFAPKADEERKQFNRWNYHSGLSCTPPGSRGAQAIQEKAMVSFRVEGDVWEWHIGMIGHRSLMVIKKGFSNSVTAFLINKEKPIEDPIYTLFPGMNEGSEEMEQMPAMGGTSGIFRHEG